MSRDVLPSSPAAVQAAVALSGAAALAMETTWLRRLALAGGSTGLATTLTLSVYMGALGVGALAAARVPHRGARTYAHLEVFAAGWVVTAPLWLSTAAELLPTAPTPRIVLLALALLGVPGLVHGATLPVLADTVPRSGLARLYALNTTGAIAGTLLWPFVVWPVAGIRGGEWAAAALAVTAAAIVFHHSHTAPPPRRHQAAPLHIAPLVVVAVSGGAALAVEVCATRVGAMLVGGSVHAFALMLAAFLAGIAAGSELEERHRPARSEHILIALGIAILAFTASWRALPHAVALVFATGGEAAWLPGTVLVFALVLAPVPLLSGAAMSAAFRHASAAATTATSAALASNTLGSVLGAAVAGLIAIPALGLWGTPIAAAVICLTMGGALSQSRGRVFALMATALTLLVPRWDPALYAVGLGLRVSEFADLSPRAVERFAHDGWELVDYTDGVTTSVAVGRSTRSGNLWLSLNGKVDASTGRDMATQELSGELPVRIAQALHPDPSAVVVGLASGVTASRTLEAGAQRVTVLEIEPAVVDAAHHFEQANHGVLKDPRTTVEVADARAWLAREDSLHHVIISEPSNPWLTGVSNLFTREYWALSRRRLHPDGVFCQWIQLYALPPDAFRGLVRTFLDVYPSAWLFETIPGADALLIAAPSLPPDLPLAPTLGPRELRRLASMGPLVTDNDPWVELTAPFWLHRQTGTTNQALIEAARLSLP